MFTVMTDSTNGLVLQKSISDEIFGRVIVPICQSASYGEGGPLAKLSNEQNETFKRHMARLDWWPAVIENGPLGSGKTYLMGEIARSRGLGLIYIGPKSVLPKCKQVAAEFRINVHLAVSYASFRGTSKTAPAWPLRKTRAGYEISEIGKAAIAAGVLVVFDEFHNLKNQSSVDGELLSSGLQTEAAITLCRAVVQAVRDNPACRSRVLLMSATPGDKIYHAYQFCRLLGIATYRVPYDVDNTVIPPRVTATGAAQIREWCTSRGHPAASGRLFDAAACWKAAFDLYTGCVMGHLADALPAARRPLAADLKNGFYNLAPADLSKVTHGVNLMCGSMEERDGVLKLTAAAMAVMNTALYYIEKGKVKKMIELAEARLVEDPRCKVVLFMNFKENIKTAIAALSHWGALEFTGDVSSDAARSKILQQFQDDNNTWRVFIATTAAGGIGIDLDDKYGYRPRWSFISPNFTFINIVQAVGRIDRMNTKSQPTVRIVYAGARTGALELRVFDAIARKTDIAHQYARNELVFPGDFESVVE